MRRLGSAFLLFFFLCQLSTHSRVNAAAHIQRALHIVLVQIQIGWIPNLHAIRREFNAGVCQSFIFLVQFRTFFAELDQIVCFWRFHICCHQHVMPLEAAAAGAWIHGAAGDLAAREIGEYGMIPEDIIERLPRLLR